MRQSPRVLLIGNDTSVWQRFAKFTKYVILLLLPSLVTLFLRANIIGTSAKKFAARKSVPLFHTKTPYII